MILVKMQGKSSQRQWDRLVQNRPESGFMQSWCWSQFKERQGQTVERWGLTKGGRLIGGNIIYYVRTSFGVSPLEIPHGPVIPWEDAALAQRCIESLMSEWTKLSSRTKAPVVRIEPLLTGKKPSCLDKFVKAPLELIPTPTLIVPLRESDETLLGSMTQKGRYNIRLALRKGVEVTRSTDLEDFYELFELTSHRHDFPSESMTFFKDLMGYLGDSKMAAVYTATFRGMPVASAVVIFFGKKVTYLYGGSSPFLKNTMASYALHWKIMQDARKRGADSYDFYGIAPEGQPLHPYSRFTQFKLRFGGEKITTLGAQDFFFYPQLAKTVLKHLTQRELVVSRRSSS